MYTKIALVLLGMTVSVGGALALVLAQSSSVKRPLAPQIALSTPDVSVKPRTQTTSIRPVLPDETVAAQPITRPVMAEDQTSVVSAPTVEIAPQRQAASPAPAIEVARAPISDKPFGAAVSQPIISPYAAITQGLNPAPLPQTQALGLLEAPRLQDEALGNTWSIGVYR